MSIPDLVIGGESVLGLELSQRAVERGLQVAYLRPGRIQPFLPPGMLVLREPSEVARAETFVVTAIHPRRSFIAGLQFLETQIPPDATILVSGFGAGPTALGAYLNHPGRLFSIGAVPPLDRQQGLAVAKGLLGQELAYERALGLMEQIVGSSYAGPDAPGMTLPRVVATLVNEAAFALGQGVAQAPDIDRAMLLGVNYPEGPLAWGDRIGLDEVLGCLLALYDHYGENRYRPAPLLRRLVQARFIGRLEGRGFYTYEGVRLHG
ncbi:MAG: 3-hydroxyacyl-CoA dehydrogenase family protein [Thermaerobacter sp.]|nr:3-hydroxyacyl-CoA dehydrogenase family protein [Thermaerobacter sp.]